MRYHLTCTGIITILLFASPVDAEDTPHKYYKIAQPKAPVQKTTKTLTTKPNMTEKDTTDGKNEADENIASDTTATEKPSSNSTKHHKYYRIATDK